MIQISNKQNYIKYNYKYKIIVKTSLMLCWRSEVTFVILRIISLGFNNKFFFLAISICYILVI